MNTLNEISDKAPDSPSKAVDLADDEIDVIEGLTREDVIAAIEMAHQKGAGLPPKDSWERPHAIKAWHLHPITRTVLDEKDEQIDQKTPMNGQHTTA